MRADPEPNDLVPCPHGERPIGEADACREDGSGRMNLLESEAGMGGVAAEQVVGKTGLGLNLRRQGSEGLANRFVVCEVRVCQGRVGEYDPHGAPATLHRRGFQTLPAASRTKRPRARRPSLPREWPPPRHPGQREEAWTLPRRPSSAYWSWYQSMGGAFAEPTVRRCLTDRA